MRKESIFQYELLILEIDDFCKKNLPISCPNTVEPSEDPDRRLAGPPVQLECIPGYQVGPGDTIVEAKCTSTASGVGEWSCDGSCDSMCLLYQYCIPSFCVRFVFVIRIEKHSFIINRNVLQRALCREQGVLRRASGKGNRPLGGPATRIFSPRSRCSSEAWMPQRISRKGGHAGHLP